MLYWTEHKNAPLVAGSDQDQVGMAPKQFSDFDITKGRSLVEARAKQLLGLYDDLKAQLEAG